LKILFDNHLCTCHALLCNWLCPSTTALWLLLTHCSYCKWKTASLPTENQVPHVNFFNVNKPLSNGCKFPCDILSQAKKNINPENELYKTEK
jgi:hypothetical protein